MHLEGLSIGVDPPRVDPLHCSTYLVQELSEGDAFDEASDGGVVDDGQLVLPHPPVHHVSIHCIVARI